VLGGMRAIARAAREHAIDVVNAQSLRMTALAGCARRLRLVRAGLVATIHNIADRSNDRLAKPILSRLPDELVFISRFERARLAESWGGEERGQVIYSGVDLPAPGSLEPLDLATLHGVAPEARVLGYVGRLSPEKAVGDAIAALPRLPEDVVLCIVGEGPEEGALRAETRRRNLERRVVFAGYSREVVIDLAGFDGLVRAIRSLLDDPSRAATMGCAARERVARLFDPKQWVDETEALFARVARGA
jgi:glycosyltransferase involved in cell wall biosynthesis